LEYQPRWSKSKADNLEDLIDFVGADKILIVGNSKDLGVKQIQTTDMAAIFYGKFAFA
jgi:hypothetical protein